jgi:hypothetical protein
MSSALVRSFLKGVMALTAGVVACSLVAAQDQTKTIRAPEYVKQRPAVVEAAGRVSLPTVARAIRVRLRRRKPVVARTKPIPKNQIETARIGVTVWRVDASGEKNKSKSLTEQDARSSDGRRLERLSADAILAIGDSVKIGVESLTHSGYLYIIDREKYADGSSGQPILLYPTLRYRDGDNSVRPGDVTLLPGPNREIVIKADTGTTQVAEELTIIVSPTRLIDPLQLQSEQVKLSSSQLLNWLQMWSRPELQIDQIDAAGLSMTRRELAAGGNQSKGLHEQALTQNDPLPQTIVEMKVKNGDPIITTVTLPIKRT